MELNAKGWAAYNRMEKKYYEELDRLKKELNDPNFEEGWCILENDEVAPTAKDYAEVLVFGDMEYAVRIIIDSFKNDPDDTLYWDGVKWKDFVRMLLPYYDLDDDDKEFLKKNGIL